MTEEDFIRRAQELIDTIRHPENDPDEDIIGTLVSDTKARGDGIWDEGIASEMMKQFEWFISQAKK